MMVGVFGAYNVYVQCTLHALDCLIVRTPGPGMADGEKERLLKATERDREEGTVVIARGDARQKSSVDPWRLPLGIRLLEFLGFCNVYRRGW